MSQRLSLYLRHLEELEASGRPTVSSSQLARALGLGAAQVRRDLAYFGQFGFPGVGYKVPHLLGEVRRILGTDKVWACALVGAGNLGTALIRHRGFRRRGFDIVHVFDEDPALVGSALGRLRVQHVRDLVKTLRASPVRLAILAVPEAAAHDVAQRLVEAGVRGILNFAPVRLAVPPQVRVLTVDLALQLEQLAFQVRSEAD